MTPPSSATPIPATDSNLSLDGRVELIGAGGQDVSAADLANTVVYFIPSIGAPRPKAGNYSVVMRNKRFEPELLVVPVGSSVSFPNQDEILHNVFSLTPGATFDLGLYGEGQSAGTNFNSATLVQAFCNVHHSMHADILVLGTPWYVRASAGGSYRLSGLPAGPGTLYFWNPRAGLQQRQLLLPTTDSVVEKLLATRPAVPEHNRKDGGSYRPTRR